MPGGKTRFQPSWLEKEDCNKQKIGLWCTKGNNDFEVKCIWCCKTWNCANSGIEQVLQHAKGKKHVDKAKLQDKSQPKLVATSTSVGERTLALHVHNDDVIRAEILWCLNLAKNNFSFRSCEDLDILREMFPDSKIANDFSLGYTKAAYLITDGLAPHLLADQVQFINSSKTPVTLHYDESTQSQVKKQLDLHLRYWSEGGHVISTYYKSAMLGHAKGKDVADKILSIMKEDGINLDQLVSLSSDGPNVNKTIWTSIQGELTRAGHPGLLNVGTCNIHVVHNAFGYALNQFAPEIPDLLIDIYTFFHNSAARREDLLDYQVKLDIAQNLPMKHVPSRWLSIGPAVDRLLEQTEVYVKYFKDLTKKPQKEQPTAKHYTRIVNTLLHHTADIRFKCLFLQTVIPIFSKFLCIFQSQSPQIHVLHDSLVELLTSLLLKFIKGETVKMHMSSDITQVPYDDPAHYLAEEEMLAGDMWKKLGNSKKQFQLGVIKFFTVTVKHLVRALPLNNNLLKDATILNPLNKGKYQCLELNRLMQSMGKHAPLEKNSVLDEWKLFQLDDNLPTWEKGDDVSNYWHQVFAQTDSTGQLKYKHLAKVVRSVLVFAHGNADVERGFSENCNLVTENRAQLSELTITSLRYVKDVVKHHGNVLKVPITRNMIKAVAGAHQQYTKRLEQERTEKEERRKASAAKKEEQARKEEERKRLKESTQSVKDKQKKLNDDEKKAKEEIVVGQDLLKEANSKLQKAIKDDDMRGIKVAHEMLKIAQTKCEQAQKVMDEVRKGQNKLSDKKHSLMDKLCGPSAKKMKQ